VPSSLVDGVHSLDFILRTCSGTAGEDPIAFKQLLSKLHKAIGCVLQLCRDEGEEGRPQALRCALVLIDLAADLLQELSTQTPHPPNSRPPLARN
jgi:hypothetical protein